MQSEMHRAPKDRRRRQGGFTLVELGVVLAVLAILVAIAVPTYVSMVNRAREAEAQQAWGMVKAELWSYFVQYNKYPTVNDDWWDGVDKPTGEWTYKGSNGTGDQSATLVAERGGRKLCWTINSTGTVSSARDNGCPSTQSQP